MMDKMPEALKKTKLDNHHRIFKIKLLLLTALAAWMMISLVECMKRTQYHEQVSKPVDDGKLN